MVIGLVGLVAIALAAASSGQPAGPPGGSPPGLDKAIAAKERHAQRLLDTPGIAGIGVGLNPAGKPVIRIYKEKPDVAGVPDSLDDVPVQSVTTGILQARAPTDPFPRPVPIGVSSGHLDTATGTLGARVTNGTDVYALSNNHVYAAINSASIGDGIIQPGNVDGGSDPGDRIGTLHDFQTINFTDGQTNTIDAALALTSTANVGTATPADGYGTPSPVTVAAFLGQGVQKYGRTTGLQLGTVAELSMTVDVCYVFIPPSFCLEDARFVNQIAITPDAFSAGGDSGSLIVTQGDNQPVALLFAGGEGRTIGNPIDLVLQRFGVTIDGSPPPDGPPSAPTALSALAGDGSATLSWTAPSFDGGSSISGYRIYRGTSPNPSGVLTTVGVQTSYTDTSATNGTTYYYKVSALNANGESPLSNQSSATPSGLVTPVEPLPTVDAFNRTENPLADAAPVARWTNGINGSVETGLYTTSNALACSKTSTCTAWRNVTQYGPDVEVWAQLTTLAGANNQLRLLARIQQAGTSTYDGYMLRPNQQTGTDQILFERVDNGVIVNLLTVNQEFAAGDVFLLRVKGSTVEAWRHDGSAWSRLGTVADSTYAAVGHAGIGIRGMTGRADDFGARSLSQNPPSAPTALSALAGDGSATLSWTAPSFDGGSSISGYRIYRGTSPNPSGVLTTVGVQTSYTDTSATNGTTYYYKVSALNANGESPLSNQSSATPSGLVTPVEPLPTVDAFNRTENPLADAAPVARWTNGINGSVETGLYTTSNALACSKTSTCTAWRNVTQYGPDVEVWAQLTTLAGANNQLRLLARIQQAGTSTYDGYMLRPNQHTGTDQILFERVDNGVIVNLLTVNQEFAAGDVFLLRVKGSTVEAWRHDGSAWSRLGTVADSTYAAVGHVGIGIRGMTGRADDFGARTFGAPPPDTEPPSAPGTLSASVLSASQIDLSWGPATDNVGVTQYRIERCSGSPCTFAQIATVGGATTTYSNTGLSPSTAYSYRVRAQDGAPVPNLGPYSNTATATTPAPPDTTPPSAPGTLTASAFSSTQIELAWQPATDDVGVTMYRIERCEGAGCSNFTEIALGTSTNHMDVFLNASTTYRYRVGAEDAAQNRGAYSNTATATTPAPPDTTPPSAPGTLTATAFSSTRIDLAWQPATDDSGAVAQYLIERCSGSPCTFAQFAIVGGATTTYSNTGLSPSTAYSYRVRAEDAALHLGAYSNEASATTQAPPDTEPPSAPGTLSASALSASQIDLSWGPATDNVGVTQYRIERCQGSGCSIFSEVATTSATSYSNSGLAASTTYSYRVRAEDATLHLGAYSNAANATTFNLGPVEPLPTLDSFNRRNENPLSDSGPWSNGVNGSVETGLRIVSNTLGCTKTTTCTGWRDDIQYGPDTEVWARVTTLPGTNNQLRLYARLQQPGTTTYDGYMLRTNQLTGADQVWIDRVDNGAIVNRLTISQELAVGDVLLLRVRGSTLEAWRRSGATWSLLGSVVDSTYGGTGYVGVGIRGKTGRLDDFGAR